MLNILCKFQDHLFITHIYFKDMILFHYFWSFKILRCEFQNGADGVTTFWVEINGKITGEGPKTLTVGIKSGSNINKYESGG